MGHPFIEATYLFGRLLSFHWNSALRLLKCKEAVLHYLNDYLSICDTGVTHHSTLNRGFIFPSYFLTETSWTFWTWTHYQSLGFTVALLWRLIRPLATWTLFRGEWCLWTLWLTAFWWIHFPSNKAGCAYMVSSISLCPAAVFSDWMDELNAMGARVERSEAVKAPSLTHP